MKGVSAALGSGVGADTAAGAGPMNVMVTWPGPAFTPDSLSWLVPALKEPPPPPLLQ